jgi:hypothetical protein
MKNSGCLHLRAFEERRRLDLFDGDRGRGVAVAFTQER